MSARSLTIERVPQLLIAGAGAAFRGGTARALAAISPMTRMLGSTIRAAHPGADNERETMKRIALLATIVLAAIAAVTFAAAGSAQSPATTSLHLVGTPQKSVGFAPKHHSLQPGDRIGSGDTITGDDTGIDRVTCTLISKRDALCSAAAQLSRGMLTAQGLVRLDSGPARYAITGGTGAYKGARGTAVVTGIPGTDKADIQITLLP